MVRGDLAIEVEFENMSYLQEEILGLCEVAHTPVIFATQALENQMKNNLPNRTEITDAAFAQRAYRIMLNKGAFVINTIKKLEFILTRIHTIFKKIGFFSALAIYKTVDGNKNIIKNIKNSIFNLLFS
jgi:pyruvate kinase